MTEATDETTKDLASDIINGKRCSACGSPFSDTIDHARTCWVGQSVLLASSDTVSDDDIMQAFYVSSDYDPKAARPADTVKAAI